MALIVNMPKWDIKDYLDIDDGCGLSCIGQWTTDGRYIYRCGLELVMNWANEKAYWWGPALAQAHINHHKHDPEELSTYWNMVETVGCEGSVATVRFYCSCEGQNAV